MIVDINNYTGKGRTYKASSDRLVDLISMLQEAMAEHGPNCNISIPDYDGKSRRDLVLKFNQIDTTLFSEGEIVEY